MSEPGPVALGDLIAGGYCSPMCLLAMIPERRCMCRCSNRFHGLASGILVAVDLSGQVPAAPASRPAAQPFHCDACYRQIGANKGHYLMDGGAVLCPRCVGNGTLHADLWADCPHQWHDPYDHLASVGTRAGTASLVDAL